MPTPTTLHDSRDSQIDDVDYSLQIRRPNNGGTVQVGAFAFRGIDYATDTHAHVVVAEPRRPEALDAGDGQTTGIEDLIQLVVPTERDRNSRPSDGLNQDATRASMARIEARIEISKPSID